MALRALPVLSEALLCSEKLEPVNVFGFFSIQVTHLCWSIVICTCSIFTSFKWISCFTWRFKCSKYGTVHGNTHCIVVSLLFLSCFWLWEIQRNTAVFGRSTRPRMSSKLNKDYILFRLTQLQLLLSLIWNWMLGTQISSSPFQNYVKLLKAACKLLHIFHFHILQFPWFKFPK